MNLIGGTPAPGGHSELTRKEIKFHFLVLNYPTDVKFDYRSYIFCVYRFYLSNNYFQVRAEFQNYAKSANKNSHKNHHMKKMKTLKKYLLDPAYIAMFVVFCLYLYEVRKFYNE